MTPPDVTAWFLVFVRASALLTTFPIFSTRALPVVLRVAVAAMLGALVAPTLPPTQVLDWPALVMLMAVEACIGLLLGFVGRLVFAGMEIAGKVLAQEMGLMTAQDLNPTTNFSSEAPSTALYVLSGMLFFTLDMHHWMIVGFQRSYGFIGLGVAHLREPLLMEIVHRVSLLFVAAVEIASPMLAISFLISLSVAILSRAVPQMNAFAESFAVRTLVGLITFGMTLNLMSQHILNYLRRLPEDMLRVAQLLGAH